MVQTDSARQTDAVPAAAADSDPDTAAVKSTAANAALVYAMFLGGLVLIGIGLWLVISGFTAGKPAGRNEPRPTVEKRTEPASSKPRYRMSYNESRRAWGLQGLAAGTDLWLPPDAFPRPGLYTPPTRPMLPQEIRESLLAAMDRNHFTLTREQFEQLVPLSLDGEALFPDLDPLKALVADATGLDRIGAALLEKREKALATPQPSEPAAISPAFDPGSDSFMENLRAWRALLQKPLAAGGTGNLRATYRNPHDEKPITIFIHARVRQRLLADDFGATAQDKAAYLQALLCQHGIDVAVDGQVGPGTRKAIRTFAAAQMPGREDSYLEYLRHFF